VLTYARSSTPHRELIEMADIDVRNTEEAPPENGYTTAELVFWIFGILMIPLAPILMIAFLTPHSGM
jgi:hypothetical protein